MFNSNFLKKFPSVIESGQNTYCENGDMFGNCFSGWKTPPPNPEFKAPEYKQCSFFDGEGCKSGYQ